jgi:heme-degrading monooxygenase HmoA
MRTLALIDHRVADFDAWKRVYDDFRDGQRRGGVVFHQVLRSREDPNRLVVTHVFDSDGAATAFLESAELRDAMQLAGVDESSVRIELLQEVEVGEL